MNSSRLKRLTSFATAIFLVGGLLNTNVFALDPKVADLWVSIKAGDLEKVRSYLATPGVDINDRYVTGGVYDNGIYDDTTLVMDDKSLLDFAVDAKQLAIATYLLDHGALVNAIQQQGLNPSLTALHRAAYFDAAEIAELLIARGANINAKLGARSGETRGATPLLFAATNGSRNSISVLLHHGADAAAGSAAGETPLGNATTHHHPEAAQLIKTYLESPPPVVNILDAARNGDLEVLHRLLAPALDQATLDEALRLVLIAGADRLDERQKIMELLVERGANAVSVIDLANTSAVAQWLISKGAHPSPDTNPDGPALSVACNPVIQDRAAVLRVFVSAGVRITTDQTKARAMLRCAVRAHDLSLAKYLLIQGAPADGRDPAGRTLLFDAPDAAMVDLLIEHGAAVGAPDSSGRTAVANAVIEHRTQVAVELIVKGALKSDAQPTLLHEAARSGQASVINALLNQGVPVDSRDADGRTALYWAVDAKDYRSSMELIKRGADINATDNAGWSALHVAASRNATSLLSDLLEHHANKALRDKQGRLPRDLATSAEARNALSVRAVAWDEPLSAKDAAACGEVVQRTADGTLGHSVAFGEPPVGEHNSQDNWDFLSTVSTRFQLSLSGDTYILGSNAGPVYLSQIRRDGVEGVVCEFSPLKDGDEANYRVLEPGERLPEDLATEKTH